MKKKKPFPEGNPIHWRSEGMTFDGVFGDYLEFPNPLSGGTERDRFNEMLKKAFARTKIIKCGVNKI